MRIIGGKDRGRRLFVPEGHIIRPTSDRIRESIFNILNSIMDEGFNNKIIVDLFSGTGALGLEAVSRGSQSTILVDNRPEALSLIRKNVQIFREGENIIVLNRDATHIGPFPYADSQADIFFMDPPYDKKLVLASLNSLIENKWLARNALCIIELSNRETIDYSLEFKLIDAWKYGKTVIHILKFGD